MKGWWQDIELTMKEHAISDGPSVTHEGTEYTLVAGYRRAFHYHNIYRSSCGKAVMHVYDGDFDAPWDGTSAPNCGVHPSEPESVEKRCVTETSEPRFDMKTLPKSAKIACLGKRSSGKTTLTMDIMGDRRDISLIVNPPCRPRGGFTVFNGFPNTYHEDLDPKMLRDLPPGMVVFEDCLYEKSIWTDENFLSVMADPELLVITNMQSPSKLSDKYSHLFVFHEPRESFRNRLWSSFMKDHFASQEDFEKALDRFAPNHHDCMVVTDGKLFAYRAPRLMFGENCTIVPWQ